MIIQHQQMQPLLAFLVVDGGDQHTLGVDAHHLSGGQIGDGDAGLAYQLFRLVVIVDAGEDHPVLAGAVVQEEFQKLLGLLDGLAFLDLHGPVVGLGEGFKVHKVLEQRLDFHVGKVDLLLHRRSRHRGHLGLFFGLFLGLLRLG